MNVFGKKKSRRLKVKERRKRAVETVVLEIKKLKRSSRAEKRGVIDATFNDLVNLTRKFFGNFFGVKYQFTYQEFERELQKKHIDPNLKKCVRNYLQFLGRKEYSPTKIRRSEMERLISEFELMIIALKKEEGAKETGFKINVEPIVSGLGNRMNASLSASLQSIRRFGSVIIKREPKEGGELGKKISKGYREMDILKMVSEAYRAIDSRDIKRANEIISDLDKTLSKSPHLKDLEREVLNLKETVKVHQPMPAVTPDEIGVLKKAVKIPVAKRAKLKTGKLPESLLKPTPEKEVLKKIKTKKARPAPKKVEMVRDWPVRDVRAVFEDLSRMAGDIKVSVSGKKKEEEKIEKPVEEKLAKKEKEEKPSEKKLAKKEKKPAPGIVIKELPPDIVPMVEFIDKALQHSIDRSVINKRLSELGWPKDKIGEAFSYVKKQ